MTVQWLTPMKPAVGAATMVAIGVLVALVSVLGLSAVGPAKTGFAIAGLALLIPAVIVRDPRAYGLFLLTSSILVELSVRLTKWLVDPKLLFQQFGMPPSGTLSVDIYVSDVILIAMLLPWFVQLSRRERSLYFPPAAYLFVLFLAWAVMISLLEAPSLHLAVFELVRKLLYFLFFLYIVNNVVTRAQFRAVVLALFIGLSVEAGVVISFFALGIGAESYLLKGVLKGTEASADALGSLTVAEAGSWSNVKRSAGTFAHPSMAAYYFEYILPIVLGSLLAARRARYRILFGAMFGAGCLSLLLTFSRSGMLGFLVAGAVFVPIARWARLISRRMFAGAACVGVAISLVGTPLLIDYLTTRPEALSLRFELLEPALDAFAKRPIGGGGLNNSAALIEGSRDITILPTGQSEYTSTVVHNYHMILLLDVGIIGYLLFIGFLWQTFIVAMRHFKSAETEMKVLLAGIVSALAGIWIHNLADPYGGHALQAMLWLELGLIFAICRRVAAATAAPVAARKTPSVAAPAQPRLTPAA